jgi:hypothetical protein
MGASVAQRFVIDHPDRVARLVLMGAFSTYQDPGLADFVASSIAPLTDPIAPPFAREWQLSTLARAMPADHLDAVVSETLKVPARIWREAFDGFLKTPDFTRELTRVAVLVLLMWGDRDSYTLRAAQDRLLESCVESYRLMVVHRALALLLIPALIATSGVVSVLHTHAYTDHDHPDHHHGLAAHEHHAEPARAGDGTAHLEGCDPGKHAVSFAFVCANPSQVHAVDAEIGPPVSLVPELQIEPAVGYADVRVHGPPARTQSSPRAPPVIALA